MFGLLLCELNTKLDGLTCLVQVCITSPLGIFWRASELCFFLVSALHVRVKSFKESLQKILPLEMEMVENGLINQLQ